MHENEKGIVYVNFTPYENSGYILDYLKYTYKTVVLFSFNFHRISKKQDPSNIRIFRNTRQIRHITLFQIPLSITYAFILLPLRSAVIFLEIAYFLHVLKRQYGPFSVFFTINAFTAWIGMIMKKTGLVEKTVFWVWDYYPPVHKNFSILIMRKFYWIFDSLAIQSDKVVFLTRRLLELHAGVNHFNYKQYPVIGIGTNPGIKIPVLRSVVRFAFLGAIKKSQGLDFLFDSVPLLPEKTKVSVEIFGGGPDDEYVRTRSESAGLTTNFHGYIPDNSELADKIKACHIGIALYKPEPDNVSYFGDPSKIKAYIENGLPVITTDVFEFHKIIVSNKAGIVVPYGDSKQFVRAVERILEQYPEYAANALKLAETFRYKKLYSNLIM